MGYDMRFYVVNRHDNTKIEKEDKDFHYGEVIASYEYCVDYDLARFIDNNSKPTDTYIWIDGKENETVVDCYGDLMKDIDLDELLIYLYDNQDTYRRQLPFIKMLEGFKQVKNQFEDLRILMYGH